MNDTPAALNTLLTHFKDTGRKPSDYDAIFTGDLGHVGKEILIELSESKGYNIKSNYNDCGVLIFDKDTQELIRNHIEEQSKDVINKLDTLGIKYQKTDS